MKKLTLVLILSFTLSTAFAEEDSTTKKLIKAKALTDNPNSTTSKLVKTGAAADVLKDSDDSATEKVIKLKMLNEAGK